MKNTIDVHLSLFSTLSPGRILLRAGSPSPMVCTIDKHALSFKSSIIQLANPHFNCGGSVPASYSLESIQRFSCCLIPSPKLKRVQWLYYIADWHVDICGMHEGMECGLIDLCPCICCRQFSGQRKFRICFSKCLSALY